jgi:hypothetical protein
MRETGTLPGFRGAGSHDGSGRDRGGEIIVRFFPKCPVSIRWWDREPVGIENRRLVISYSHLLRVNQLTGKAGAWLETGVVPTLPSSSPITSNASLSLLVEAATLPLLPLLLSFLPPANVPFRPSIDFKPENPVPWVGVLTVFEDPLVRACGRGEKSDGLDAAEDSRLSERADC